MDSLEQSADSSGIKHKEALMMAAVKQTEAGRKVVDAPHEVGGERAHDLCVEAERGGMGASEAQEAKRFRDENAQLKILLLDLGRTCRLTWGDSEEGVFVGDDLDRFNDRRNNYQISI